MTIRRTPRGLQNLHLFHRVDMVIFCEGGPVLTVQQIRGGQGDQNTLDVAYWETLFRLSKSQKTAHFKSIGSKTTLLAFAQELQDKNTSRIRLCMDRDYDEYRQSLIASPFIIYTHGYSWENDVLNRPTFSKVFWRFRNSNDESRALHSAVLGELDSFISSIRRHVESDIALLIRRGSCFLPHNAPMSILDITGDTPTLNTATIQSRLARFGYSKGPRRVAVVSDDEVSKVCFGHLLAKYVYHLFRMRVLQGLTYDAFMRCALGEFEACATNGELSGVIDHCSHEALAIFR